MTKNIVFLDLDGTLLKDDLSISSFSVKSINALKENYDFIISTGRSVSDSYTYYNLLELDTPLICYNGAFIKSGNSKYFITSKSTKYIDCTHRLLQYLEINFKEVIENMAICLEETTYLYNLEDEDLLNIILHPKFNFDLKKDYIFEMHEAHRIIISSVGITEADKKRIQYLFPEINIVNWKNSPQIIDICLAKCDKWDMIKLFIKENSINPELALFFGDSMNDLKTIKNLKNSYAMKNATKDIQKYARNITHFDNNNDGVVKELLNFTSK